MVYTSMIDTRKKAFNSEISWMQFQQKVSILLYVLTEAEKEVSFMHQLVQYWALFNVTDALKFEAHLILQFGVDKFVIPHLCIHIFWFYKTTQCEVNSYPGSQHLIVYQVQTSGLGWQCCWGSGHQSGMWGCWTWTQALWTSHSTKNANNF